VVESGASPDARRVVGVVVVVAALATVGEGTAGAAGSGVSGVAALDAGAGATGTVAAAAELTAGATIPAENARRPRTGRPQLRDLILEWYEISYHFD
jgi:hypothetical protein